WIEGLAIQQLHTTANLPHMQRVVGMPDLHPGRGYPIGAAFFSLGHLYPALVGNDIGCGMALWQTDILARKYNADKFEKKLSAMGDVAQASWLDEHLPENLLTHPWRSALGSIGGGNHFAELQQVEQVVDNDRFQQAGLDAQRLLLLAHSGSRGLGQSILQHHIAAFSHDGLAEGSAAARDYLAEHDDALAFARVNRYLIATRILQQIRADGRSVLDIAHNFVESCSVDGQQGWLHRKGATPDDRGLVIIPGSRGDHSWLVQSVTREETLHSLAHGAGRKWMRTECKGRLSGKYSPAQLARTELGSRVICRDRQLIYEEAPQAYKSVESILNCLVQAGLVEPIARLRPLLTLKTSGGKSA
ncbi:RNA ligase RtcB family protein, partial [Klebsiella oxytoca]|uniref:RNA ligase RtcB family protein n=1 Tax=Klebsiella oxytoca TaxID=571 RepID=UPI001CCBC624